MPIIPGVIPIASYAQVSRICRLCDASIPDGLEQAMRALGGDAEAEALLGVAYAALQCDELLAAGAPGIHFYALNRAPGVRAVLSALRASRPWERVEAGAQGLPRYCLDLDCRLRCHPARNRFNTPDTGSPTTSTARATA